MWDDPATFTTIGSIPASEISKITHGMMSEDVPVSLNKLINDYDQLLICGPVFPHEVVGFSGGNKYLFPGIAGAEIINFTHWLGATITNYEIIGAGYTPVRAVIDRAAAMVKQPVSCFCMVVTHEGLAGIYFGNAREAWHAAAVLSSQKHIVYVDKPYQRVISVMPQMYDDLWTAAKGHVQNGAGRGRWRRSDHLRAAYHRGQLYPRQNYWIRSVITAVIISSNNGTSSNNSRMACWRIPPTCADSALMMRKQVWKPCASR